VRALLLQIFLVAKDEKGQPRRLRVEHARHLLSPFLSGGSRAPAHQAIRGPDS
jgi:hypothetical protein